MNESCFEFKMMGILGCKDSDGMIANLIGKVDEGMFVIHFGIGFGIIEEVCLD